jgi:5-(carboxyamino)imidazole ribonucleotide synthase
MENQSMETTGPIAILGGGQLARMLALAAAPLGIPVRVLAARSSDPAAQLAQDSIYGGWDEPVVLRRLLSQVHGAIFESEFVPCDRLEEAAEGLAVEFQPPLRSVYLLQDKVRQKELLGRLGIPTSPYQVYTRDLTPARWTDSMLQEFSGECVIKWAQQGYDGLGTWIAPGGGAAEAASFVEKALARSLPVYAERKVSFKRELAMVAIRSARGEFAAYPLVISEQEKGVCRRVYGPATALGVAGALEQEARGYAQALAEALPIHGAFAIEFFETHDGRLLVNELAPRVHNSGHYTQDACSVSQFENHWRGVLGLPLGPTDAAPGFAMLNLLGPREVATRAGSPGPWDPLPFLTRGLHLHWYGKTEIRAGRKMGHVNGVVSASQSLPGLLAELDRFERSWKERIIR